MNNSGYYQSNKDLAKINISKIRKQFTKETSKNKDIQLPISEVTEVKKCFFNLIKCKMCTPNDKAIMISEFSGTMFTGYVNLWEVQDRCYIYDRKEYFDRVELFYDDLLDIAKDFKRVLEETSNREVSMFDIREILEIRECHWTMDKYRDNSSYDFKSYYELMK